MSDLEEFFMDWVSPGKRKRKKNLKEKERCKKHENDFTIKDQKKKKKKKKMNSKDAIVEKKKEKRKKKLKDSHSGCVVKFTDSHPHNTDHLTQDSKKSKIKKKVSFDLSPSYLCAKHPKFVSSSPKEKTLPEKEAVTDITCCQVTKIQPSQAQPQDFDSQCTSDDINSQDLFITQKTFKTSYSESSSGEASDKAASQQTMTQRGVLHNSPVLTMKYDGGANAHFPVHPKMVEQSPLKAKAAPIPQVEQNLKKPIELNTNTIGEKRVYGTAPVKPRTVNQYLEDPIVVKGPLVGTKSSTLRQERPPCLPNTNRPFPTMQSISTQTENFFTAELSSYLRFRRQRFCLETLEALDLSLPQMATKDPDTKKPSEQKASPTAGTMKVSSLQTSSFSQKEAEKLKEPAVRQLWYVKSKGQSAPSPQSDSEPKSADTTSSEDNEPVCGTGKVDLTQVKAVQMRLNESFFFKTKGHKQSPRPESPLMKLVQSREVKNSK